MYGGVFTWNEDGNLVRQEGGQMYEFPRGDDPNEDFFDAPWWQLKPYYDGTVYSFEYTEEGIRIKRYTYVPGLIPPVADFAFYPPQGPAPLSVTFQNYSCDEDGEIVRIECDWNGIHETIEGDPATFEHIFTEPGDNPFTLTVVDNDEQTDSWAGSVYVEPPSG
jgi:PKD repeat protein